MADCEWSAAVSRVASGTRAMRAVCVSFDNSGGPRFFSACCFARHVVLFSSLPLLSHYECVYICCTRLYPFVCGFVFCTTRVCVLVGRGLGGRVWLAGGWLNGPGAGCSREGGSTDLAQLFVFCVNIYLIHVLRCMCMYLIRICVIFIYTYKRRAGGEEEISVDARARRSATEGRRSPPNRSASATQRVCGARVLRFACGSHLHDSRFVAIYVYI